MSTHNAKVIALLALCVATLVLFYSGLQYQTVVTDLLPNLRFETGFAHWESTPNGIGLLDGEPPAAILTVGPGALVPVLMQPLSDPQRFRHVRVAADVAADGIEPGVRPWERGGIMFYSYAKDGRRLWYWPSEVGTFTGSSDWRRYESVFPVNGDAEVMRLFVYTAGTSGSLSVRDVEMDALDEAVWFTVAEAVAATLWIALVLWTTLPLLHGGDRRRERYLMLIVGAAIAALLLAPQPRLNDTVADAGAWAVDLATSLAGRDSTAGTVFPVTATIAGPAVEAGEAPPSTDAARRQAAEEAQLVLPKDPERGDGKTLGVSRDVMAHLALHALFACLVAWAFPLVPWRGLLATVLAIAVASEVMQVFTVTRSVQVEDGLFNGVGVLIGLVAFACVERHRAGPRRPRLEAA